MRALRVELPGSGKLCVPLTDVDLGPYSVLAAWRLKKEIRSFLSDLSERHSNASRLDWRSETWYNSSQLRFAPVHRQYLAGFSDENQLRRWFDKPDLEGLAQHGFHLAHYEVSQDDVFFGQMQLAFPKRSRRTGQSSLI